MGVVHARSCIRLHSMCEYDMARAWSGEDTEKAMDHYHKAILLLWKMYANRLNDPDDFDSVEKMVRVRCCLLCIYMPAIDRPLSNDCRLLRRRRSCRQ